MGASYEDIKASYRRLARIYHPDANPANQQQAKEKFIQLTDAYRRLESLVASAPQLAESSEPSPQQASDLTSNQRSHRSHRSPAAAPKPKNAAPPPSPQVRITPDLSPVDRQLKQESYQQLQQFLREQRFPRAIALVEGLSQRLVHDVEVRQWQAITYQRFGRYLIRTNQPDKAKIYLQKALRTDPQNRSLWYEVDRDLRQIDQVEVL